MQQGPLHSLLVISLLRHFSFRSICLESIRRASVRPEVDNLFRLEDTRSEGAEARV